MTYPHNRTATEKEDLFFGKKVAKALRGETKLRKPNSHEESNLHLAFCKWLKLQYPHIGFIRHERERARSKFSGSLMALYNSLDGIPDFECVDGLHGFKSLFIEFKKPGEKWLDKYGYVKKEYEHQYKCHLKLWDKGKPAYFCNDLEMAMQIFRAYSHGVVLEKQIYPLRPVASDLFF